MKDIILIPAGILVVIASVLMLTQKRECSQLCGCQANLGCSCVAVGSDECACETCTCKTAKCCKEAK